MEKELIFRQQNLIPKELAIEIVNLGFNDVVIGGYYEDGTFAYHPDSDIVIDVPLFQQAFRFFREKYNIDKTIITNYAKIDKKTIKTYRVGIILINGNAIESFFLRPDKDKLKFIEFDTYEEAELECLRQLINLTKNSNGSKK